MDKREEWPFVGLIKAKNNRNLEWTHNDQCKLRNSIRKENHTIIKILIQENNFSTGEKNPSYFDVNYSRGETHSGE